MGDYLPFTNVGEEVISVHVGDLHTCAVLSSLEMKCWGRSAEGGGNLISLQSHPTYHSNRPTRLGDYG